jgi:hypothetical protein
MTTQNAPECPANSLAIIPQGDAWQAIKTPPPPTLEEIIDRMARQLEAIDAQIEAINSQLKTIQ